MFPGIFDRFPEINIDNQFVLRQISIEDVEGFYKYITDQEVTKFLSAPEIPLDILEAETELMYWAGLYTKKRSIYWAISDKKDEGIIGTCGFNSWNRAHRRAEISYDLSHHYWNKGLMTKVVKSITEFAFHTMQVARVQGTVVHYNAGSCRVLEKCGYQREGILRNYGVLHGKSQDYYMYSSIK